MPPIVLGALAWCPIDSMVQRQPRNHGQLKRSLRARDRGDSGATLEGLENRKKDLLSRIKNDLNIDEKNLLINSDLKLKT